MTHRICILVVAFGVGVGCGGTVQPVVVNYDSGQDRTTYRSKPIPVPVERPGSGYGSQFEELRMDLRGVCTGRACRPDRVRLTLSTTGSSEIYIGDRTFTVTADDEQFTWQDLYERRNRTEQVVGTVLQVSMPVGRLRKIAGADHVEGRIGTIRLELDGRTQESVRAFLTEVEGSDAPL